MRTTMSGKRAAISTIGVAALLAAGGAWTATAADTSPTQPQAGEAGGPVMSEQDWTKFDKCLSENGVPLAEQGVSAESTDETAVPSKAELQAIDQAFDKCESTLPEGSLGEVQILTGPGTATALTDEVGGPVMSEQDWTKFDKCLSENGVPLAEQGVSAESTDETAVPSKAELQAIDQAFDKCESTLPEGSLGKVEILPGADQEAAKH